MVQLFTELTVLNRWCFCEEPSTPSWCVFKDHKKTKGSLLLHLKLKAESVNSCSSFKVVQVARFSKWLQLGLQQWPDKYVSLFLFRPVGRKLFSGGFLHLVMLLLPSLNCALSEAHFHLHLQIHDFGILMRNAFLQSTTLGLVSTRTRKYLL